MGKHRFCLSTWVPCHHFAHPYLAFLPYCQSASPLVMLSSTLDAETTACLSIPISLYSHARTSFITNPLFYSIHRSHSSLIKPVIMYGCESWTIKKAECQRIDAFELGCWRRLLRVPWTAAYQGPPSIGFSRQEYWSGVPLPSPLKSLLQHNHSKASILWHSAFFIVQLSHP